MNVVELTSVWEADLSEEAESTYLGLFVEEVGSVVLEKIVKAYTDRAVDFGGNEKDILVSNVVAACEGSATKLSRSAGITKKEAELALAFCK
jgi:hypothetical protein